MNKRNAQEAQALVYQNAGSRLLRGAMTPDLGRKPVPGPTALTDNPIGRRLVDRDQPPTLAEAGVEPAESAVVGRCSDMGTGFTAELDPEAN